MPYLSKEHLRRALELLVKEYSPLLVVSVPAMLAKGIPTAPTEEVARTLAVEFGSPDEYLWLNRYFRVSGGPSDKPYFMPTTKTRVAGEYPAKSLQRIRKSFELSVFFHPDAQRWAFTPTAASFIKEKVLKGQPRLPLAALLVWMYRERPISSLQEALQSFIAATKFDRDDFLRLVYDASLPNSLGDIALAPQPVTSDTLAELLDDAPPAPAGDSMDEMVRQVEQSLKAENYIPSEGLVRRIIGGWMLGNIVVLVGPSGSGKSSLAQGMGRGLGTVLGARFRTATLEIAPDCDAATFLGYENLAGTFTAGAFAQNVLFVGEPTDPRLVILDEWNLAQIDTYFAPVLPALEERRAATLPGRMDWEALGEASADVKRAQPSISEGRWHLPEDTFFLATCNSWTDEPDSRLAVSGPIKRRCCIIAMPNILEFRYKRDGQAGLKSVVTELLTRERTEVEQRRAAGTVSVLDTHRHSRLTAVASLTDLDEKTAETLLRVAGVLLKSTEASSSFTMGVFRDILLACTYSSPGDDYACLGRMVADKVLHQLRGEPRLLEIIIDTCQDLPNAMEIAALAKRMGAFSGERRIRPLL